MIYVETIHRSVKGVAGTSTCHIPSFFSSSSPSPDFLTRHFFALSLYLSLILSLSLPSLTRSRIHPICPVSPSLSVSLFLRSSISLFTRESSPLLPPLSLSPPVHSFLRFIQLSLAPACYERHVNFDRFSSQYITELGRGLFRLLG